MRLPIKEAVADYKAKHGRDIKIGTVRRWCREGCPKTKGGKGRGRATLVDIEEIMGWLGATQDQRQIIELAEELPRLMAKEILMYWRELNRPDKRKLAAAFSVAWQVCAVAAVEHMQKMNPDIPGLDSFPEEIQRLEEIAK